MYCRKCIKSNSKVNMAVNLKEQRYTCSKCNHVVEWKHKELISL